MSFKAVCPAAGKRSPRERSPRVPRTFKHTGGTYAIGSFLPAPFVFFFFFWRTELFCLRQSTFYGAFNDSSTEVAVAVFRFRPEAVPRSSLSFPFISLEEGEGRGQGWGLLAPVCFCISLLTLQQKWEEASGLPGILWGRKRGHWRGNNLGTKRQTISYL